MRKEREINIDLKNLKEEDTTKIEDVYVNKYNQVVEDGKIKNKFYINSTIFFILFTKNQ